MYLRNTSGHPLASAGRSEVGGHALLIEEVYEAIRIIEVPDFFTPGGDGFLMLKLIPCHDLTGTGAPHRVVGASVALGVLVLTEVAENRSSRPN